MGRGQPNYARVLSVGCRAWRVGRRAQTLANALFNGDTITGDTS